MSSQERVLSYSTSPRDLEEKLFRVVRPKLYHLGLRISSDCMSYSLNSFKGVMIGAQHSGYVMTLDSTCVHSTLGTPALGFEFETHSRKSFRLEASNPQQGARCLHCSRLSWWPPEV